MISKAIVDGPRLGQSKSNYVVNNASRWLTSAYRNMNGLDADRFGDDEIANENLQHYFTGFCRFLCTTLVPTHRKYDENFQPTDPDCQDFLKTGTLKQYVGQHFLDCRRQHQSHRHFIDRLMTGFPYGTQSFWPVLRLSVLDFS